jgi:hypothetical protein
MAEEGPVSPEGKRKSNDNATQEPRQEDGKH